MTIRPSTKGNAKVGITDTTLRDAHQSLYATRLKTEDLLQIASYMDKVGFYSMEVWGGATFDSCLRFLNEDPWERLKLLRQYIPNTPLQMLLRGQTLVGYRPYADDVVDDFIAKSVDCGIDVVRIFDALNDIRNVERAALSTKKAGAHFQGAICYTISPVHTGSWYISYAKQLKDLGADSICIKDMAGILSPYVAFDLVSALKSEVGLPIDVHSHCSSGMASMTYLKAIEAGADIVDCANSAISLGSSQPPEESIIVSLSGTKYDTNLNAKLLKPVATILKELLKDYAQVANPITVDTDVLNYQVPGGMISNLKVQLKQSNSESRLQEILNEVPNVRKDLGYPPLVTPMSQMVGTQSTLNVITGKRYSQIPKEVRGYIHGDYGKPSGDISPELKSMVMGDDEVFTGRPGDRIPSGMEEARSAVKTLSERDEDVLSYAIYPDQTIKYLKDRSK